MNNPCAYQVGDKWYLGILVHIQLESLSRFDVDDGPNITPDTEFFIADYEFGDIDIYLRKETRVFSTFIMAREFIKDANAGNEEEQ